MTRHIKRVTRAPNGKVTRPAGAEDLCEACADLTEGGRVGDVAAILNQVGGVEKIEDLAEQDKRTRSPPGENVWLKRRSWVKKLSLKD